MSTLRMAPLVLVVVMVATARTAAAQGPEVAGVTYTEPSSACSAPAPPSLDESLKVERQARAAVERQDASAADWLELACARNALYERGAIAAPGPELPMGASWYEGAVRASMRALERDPAHADAAELLGHLVLQENYPQPITRIVDAIVAADNAGVSSPAFLRGCAKITREHLPLADAGTCSDRALALGVDSTFHLLELTRLHAAVPDTATASMAFEYAVEAARDSSDWAAIEWHLTWFLNPDEMTSWEELEPSGRGAWVRDRFMSRDIRDGKPRGSRLLEHFHRLEVADSHFRRQLPKKDWGRFDHAATPESELMGGWMIKYWEPGLAAAEAFRVVKNPHRGYDDRAAVWMRFGRPEARLYWGGVDREPTYGDPVMPEEEVERQMLRKPGTFASNTREVWRYNIDGQALLLHFEAENFDGAVGAGRLVVGVLGHYLCDVDAYRCNLTQQASTPGDHILVTPEKVATLRQDDRDAAMQATTRDDNSVRTDEILQVVAELHRVRDPRTREPLALVPYAIRTADLIRQGDSTNVAITLRQWDPTKDEWHEVQQRRRMTLARVGKRDYVTGSLVVPSSPGVTAWGLTAEQQTTHRGRAWDDGRPTLVAGDPFISDLVLGATNQGQAWRTSSGEEVWLAPLGAFDRTRSIEMYWQLDHQGETLEAVTTIALYRAGLPDGEAKALEITERMTFDARLHEVIRSLDVARLDRGSYRLELVVGLDGGRTVRRSTRLLLD